MQLLLGHANIKTTIETYMHIEYEDKQISIKMIENTPIGIEAPQPADPEIITSDKMLHNKWSKTQKDIKT